MDVKPPRPTTEHAIATPTHGRYVVAPGPSSNAPLLLGFHGYAETAEVELRRLQTIPGTDSWRIVSIEGLHQFYRRSTNEVVASWMTRQNRDLAIGDNISYVNSVVRLVSQPLPSRVVLSGFSQGVAMAFRAAVRIDGRVSAVIALGGDVPPELESDALARIPMVLLGRGARDEWYTSEKLASDEERLSAAGVRIQTVVLEAGHEWTAEFSEISAQFLRSVT